MIKAINYIVIQQTLQSTIAVPYWQHRKLGKPQQPPLPDNLSNCGLHHSVDMKAPNKSNRWCVRFGLTFGSVVQLNRSNRLDSLKLGINLWPGRSQYTCWFQLIKKNQKMRKVRKIMVQRRSRDGRRMIWEGKNKDWKSDMICVFLFEIYLLDVGSEITEEDEG